MKRTNSFLKRPGSSNGTVKHKRSCQRALAGFCLGRCCGPLHEKTSQMRLHYMHTPSWKGKRINHLQLTPQTGNLSVPTHDSNIKLEELHKNVPMNSRGRGRGAPSLPLWSHSGLTLPLLHRSLQFTSISQNH